MIRSIVIIILFFILNSFASFNYFIQSDNKIIVDCNYSFAESVKGIEIPKSILKQLTLLDVEYFSFDNKLHRGQLVVNKSVKKDILEIFEFIKKTKFPIAKVTPVVRYN